MDSDGYCNDTIVKRKECCKSFTCMSPRLNFRRWLGGGGPTKMVERERKRGKELVKNLTSEKHSASRRREESEQSKETSFNVGLGFGLIYLIAASSKELSKMWALHKEMEMLMKNFRNEFQNKEKNPFQTQNAKEHFTDEFSSSSNLQNQEIIVQYPNYRREKSLRMDKLEAELEAEFGRIQIDTDTDVMSKESVQQYMEIDVEDSGPEESSCTNFGEVSEQPMLVTTECYGVCPVELERRLHQLLQQRQQERIKELELALDRAMHELYQKDRQISWWKDTACLASQHAKDAHMT